MGEPCDFVPGGGLRDRTLGTAHMPQYAWVLGYFMLEHTIVGRDWANASLNLVNPYELGRILMG